MTENVFILQPDKLFFAEFQLSLQIEANCRDPKTTHTEVKKDKISFVLLEPKPLDLSLLELPLRKLNCS